MYTTVPNIQAKKNKISNMEKKKYPNKNIQAEKKKNIQMDFPFFPEKKNSKEINHCVVVVTSCLDITYSKMIISLTKGP